MGPGTQAKGVFDAVGGYVGDIFGGKGSVINRQVDRAIDPVSTAIAGAIDGIRPEVDGISNNYYGGGQAAPSLTELDRAGIAATQKAIDALSGIRQQAIENERTKYNNALRGYTEQEKLQRGVYDDSTVNNQLNYDSTFMDAIRAGIGGFGNLMSLLRGTGAAGGTAQDQVRDAVGATTAADIRGAADTRGDNQSALDTTLSTFLTDLEGKRRGANDTYETNLNAARRDSLSQQQDLFEKMAGYYKGGGDDARAADYIQRAGNLTPQLAKYSNAVVSKYDASPVQVNSPELTAFAESSQPNISSDIPQDGQVGSGIFSMNRQRDKRQTTPVGV